MFDWIPFVAGGLILLWAAASFARTVRGAGPGAGLHELATAAPSDDDTEEMPATDTSGGRMIPFPVIQALQYLVAGAVVLAGIWLTIQTID